MEVPSDQEKKVSHVREWVAERAAIVRTAAGFTQQQIAKKMAVHVSRVCDFEKNRTDAKGSTIYRFSIACGIPIEKFFRGIPSSKRAGTDQKRFLVIEEDKLAKSMKEFGFAAGDIKGFIKHMRDQE